VTGDRYAGEFPRELFRKHGIAYDLAKQTKSELFRDLLPLLNSGRIVLPRNDRLQGQIVGLERRTSAVGRDTISHPDRGHDDVANAVAGAAALSKFGGYDTSLRWVSGDDDDSAWQRVRLQAGCVISLGATYEEAHISFPILGRTPPAGSTSMAFFGKDTGLSLRAGGCKQLHPSS
jgi:hypothetical protein